MNRKYLILLSYFCFVFTEGLAQQHFQTGDRALYFFDLGPKIETVQLSNLRTQLKQFDIPEIATSLGGIQLNLNLYVGKRVVVGGSFGYLDYQDSTLFTLLQQRNFQMQVHVGYNILKARKLERFGLVPHVGVYRQRNIVLYNRMSDEEFIISVNASDFALRKGKNKIIRNAAGALASLRFNYSLRTHSLLDIFSFGLEPGFKYNLTSDNLHFIKKRKLFYKGSEQRLAPFLTIHFKVPLAVFGNESFRNNSGFARSKKEP